MTDLPRRCPFQKRHFDNYFWAHPDEDAVALRLRRVKKRRLANWLQTIMQLAHLRGSQSCLDRTGVAETAISLVHAEQ
jgi:hypothetical protein